MVAAGCLTLAARYVEPLLETVERLLAYLSATIILFVMAFVCLEVLMRYLLNSPIPGHLEGAELLLPMIVFFAVSHTQAENAHVGMTLVVESLPGRGRRNAEVATLFLSLATCAVLSYFSAKHAYRGWEYDDVTMSPPYWPTWPSSAAVPVGYFLIAVRMYFQMLRRIAPRRLP